MTYLCMSMAKINVFVTLIGLVMLATSDEDSETDKDLSLMT